MPKEVYQIVFYLDETSTPWTVSGVFLTKETAEAYATKMNEKKWQPYRISTLKVIG